LETRKDTDRAKQPRSPATQVAAFFALIFGYVVLGLAGLELQSSQTGVTPVWPASGFAFAMIFWFGLPQLGALLPALLTLGWIVGLPLEVVLVSAFGNMLEAGVPVYLLRRLGVDPRLGHLRDVLLFVGLGPVLGPALSATSGSLAFQMLDGGSLDVLRIWFLWWLGNSVGLLLVGGFGLVAVARRTLKVRGRGLLELLIACLAVALITAVGLWQVVSITSPLVLYLLIPVFVLLAQRGDQYLVMLLAVTAMGVTLLSSLWLPPDSLEQAELGIFYLDVSLLWVVVFTGMVTSSARSEMRSREQVSWLATHDPLTRLLNRHALMERLEQVLARDDDPQNSVLMFLDLDKFKDLNDAEGHRAGDRVLRDVSALLLEEVRAADWVARLGGDEFAVILTDCQLLDACSIAENIRSVIERYEYAGRHAHHRVEVSIGLLELTERHQSPEDALHDVDSACYEAKRAGRNRVWVYSLDEAPVEY
jgi:diguanylate cyclase (GGDEF)-like protein